MADSLTFMMGKFAAVLPADRRYARNHMWCLPVDGAIRFAFSMFDPGQVDECRSVVRPALHQIRKHAMCLCEFAGGAIGAGQRDSQTGMIANLGDLDPFVEREVLEAFDQKYLNEQVPQFQASVPTTENVVREIYRRLQTFPSARLERVRIQETSNNSFEYDATALQVHP